FFFQAEDGIRDFHVTGVQTCALPILVPRGTSRMTSLPSAPVRRPPSPPFPDSAMTCFLYLRCRRVQCWAFPLTIICPPLPPSPRSEERRVGKEGRSPGAAER